MLARACAILLAAGLAGLAGCGPAKLEVEKSYTVDPRDYKTLVLEKQSQPQKLTIDVNADNEVNVLVVDSNLLNTFEGMAPGKQVEAAKYGKGIGLKTGTVTAEVPANTEVMVAVGGGPKTTKVTVSISNRK